MKKKVILSEEEEKAFQQDVKEAENLLEKINELIPEGVHPFTMMITGLQIAATAIACTNSEEFLEKRLRNAQGILHDQVKQFYNLKKNNEKEESN